MAGTELPEAPAGGPGAVTIDVGAAAPRGRPCDACGCPVEQLDHFCPACGVPQAESAAPPGSGPAQVHLRCQNCGSQILADPAQRSFLCPFCDAAYVVEYDAEETDRQAPEFVIGFAVTPEQAEQAFRSWLGRRQWFRPGDLTSAAVSDKLKGVYLPFWSFSMLAESRWSAEIGEYWYRTETYRTRDAQGRSVTRTRQVRETEWWPLRGRYHGYYSGFLVSGSRGLPQPQAAEIQPFNLPALKRYEPYFLAGWLSEEYSIDQEAAWQVCQREFERRRQAHVAAFMPGDTHRTLDVHTSFHHVQPDLCLLPVYLLTYRYQGQVYRFLVNGQTGKSVGEKPVSWRRVGVGVGGLLVLVLLVILLVWWLSRHV